MKWGDCMMQALGRMYMLDHTRNVEDLHQARLDAELTEMLNMMPGAANEGMALMASALPGIVRTAEFTQMLPKNLLGTGFVPIFRRAGGEVVLEAADARSFSAICVGRGQVEVRREGAAEPAYQSGFEGFGCVVRGLIPEGAGRVRMRIFSKEPFCVRSAALFAAAYESAERVPEYRAVMHYSLPEQLPDFYRLCPGGISPADGAQLEGTDVLKLGYEDKRVYRIMYRAWPKPVAADTPDEEELDLPEELAQLLPLYVASVLYMDADAQAAVQWRNEFERGLAAVMRGSTPRGGGFVSRTGWWGTGG